MNTAAAALAAPVRPGLVGAGRIGTAHATPLVALACIESVRTATPVLADKVDAR